MRNEQVSAAELAYRWQLTESRIHQLVKERVLPKIARGKFDPDECTWAYLGYLRAQIKGRFTENELDRAKLEKEQLEVRRRRIELARAQGDLIWVEDHLTILGKFVAGVRSKLLGFPGPWGPRIVGIASPAQGTEAMRTLVEEALTDLGRIAEEVEELEIDEGIPDDFPGFKHLAAAHVTSFRQLLAIEDLTMISGIGKVTASRIQEQLPPARGPDAAA